MTSSRLLPRLAPLRTPVALSLFALAFLIAGADGCTDPNVQGARNEMNNQDYERVLELTSMAIESDPANGEAHFLRGEAFRMKAEGMPNDAAGRGAFIEDMTLAYASARTNGYEPSDIDNRLQVAWAFEMTRGQSSYRRAAEDPSAYGDAATAYQNAITLQPDSSAGYLNQSLALIAADRSTEAAEPLQMAIDKGANSVDAYIYLGRIYLAEGQASDALAVLEEGQAMFPENEDIQTELLNAYGRTGNAEQAIERYAEAVEREPDDPVLRYNYGSFLLQDGRYDEAAEQLMRATELDSQNANAYYNLGAAYQNKAASFNDQISELEDADAPRADVEAVVAQRSDLLAQAMPNLERARELTEAGGDDTADICRALFQVYASLRQNDKAEEAAECAGLDLN
ncbi:MAG: tetratricopeptide repeat protein [Bacteroidota bacterium]